MPIDRSRYPVNWREISWAVKEAADWTCQVCGQECARPGERVTDWSRVLTVAHLDQNPANNDPANLAALCVRCHLAHDREFNRRKRLRTLALRRAGATLPLPI